MTFYGALGCTLIGIGPCLTLFIFTIASNPIKVIIMTASGFFWLLSLLVASVIWFVVVPLRPYLVFGLVTAVLVQEAMRFAFFKLMAKADAGLKLIVLNAKPVAFRGVSTHNRNYPDPGNANDEVSDPSITNQLTVFSNQEDLGLLVNSPMRVQNTFLNHNVVAYVSGLGFGLMSCIIELLRILLDSRGPGVFSSYWESKAFFVIAACECTCISLLQIFWSLILYSAFAQCYYYYIALVCIIHIGLSCMSLLNNYQSPWPEVVCAIYFITLLGTIVLACFTLRVASKRLNITETFQPARSQSTNE